MILRALALATLIAIASCAPQSSSRAAAPSPAGSDLPVASSVEVGFSIDGASDQRIVSLIPSFTEDLFAIGAGKHVVGVSEYTDYPPAARELPVVSSFASVNAERIVALHPNVVFGIPSQSALVRDLERAHVPVMLLKDDSLADVYENLQVLGVLTDREAASKALVARLKARTAMLTRSARRGARRPSVFVVLGTAPIYTVGRGSYIASLLELAGARNAAADVHAPYARYSAEALVAHSPDVLVVDPDIRFQDVSGTPPWNALRAVREHRVFTLPDAALLERPGPRYNDGLAWLIAALQKVPT